MVDMGRGTVVYYNGAVGKNFGFILPDGATGTVFFHNTYQRTYRCDGGNEPVIEGWTNPPKKGDRVVFLAERTDKGERAKFWANEENYDAAWEAVANRPMIRLRTRQGRIPKSRLWEKPEYRTLWEGENVRDLRRLYPKRFYPVLDKEEYATLVERHDPDTGLWEACADPR